MGIQIVSVIGNATKDAEKKVSKDGISYVSFRIAVSGVGESATFYNIVVFGHYGEAIQPLITKGREVFVSGRLQVSEQGYISIVADHVELLRYPKTKTKEEEKEPLPKEAKPAKTK